jgi:hypothetical protein
MSFSAGTLRRVFFCSMTIRDRDLASPGFGRWTPNQKSAVM